MTSSAQSFELGSPLIHNIPPAEYGYESQNFSIVQDKSGYIYIANLSGLIEYDGISCNLIKVAGAFALETSSDGVVYVGGYNEFGYLDVDQFGEKTYVSLIDKLPKESRNFASVNEILKCKDEMFFYAKNKLFRWNSKDIICIDSSDTYLRAFVVRDKLYVSKFGVGLLEYSGASFSLVVEGNFFREMRLLEIMPYKDKLMIKADGKKGFFLYSPESIETFNTTADDFLESNKYSIGKPLANNLYALGTKRCGVVIINDDGDVLYNINLSSGLYDDDIEDIFVDRANNLWLATNNGVSFVQVPDPFTYFDRSMGLYGGSKVITRHKGRLYVATTQGLFYLLPTPELKANCFRSIRFEAVDGVYSDGNSFFSHGDNLFLAADDGLFRIGSEKATLVFEGRHEIILQSTKNPEIFYCGRENGVTALSFNDGSFIELGDIENVSTHVRTIVEEENGNLWLGTDYDGVYHVNLAQGWNSFAIVDHFEKGQGLPVNYDWIDVYETSRGILFSTAKGLYRYNKLIRRFYLDTLVGIDFTKETRWVFPIVEDSEENLLFSSGLEHSFQKKTGLAEFISSDTKYQLLTDPFDKLKNFTIEDIFPDSNNVVWMATFDGLIRIEKDLLNRAKLPFVTHINKILVEHTDSLLLLQKYDVKYDHSNAFSESFCPELAYQMNSISFEFGAPTEHIDGPISFSFLLEENGEEVNGWSEWITSNSKEYTNLQEGNYTFRVRARNSNEEIADEAIFHFTISAPFYRTWWAYLTYFIFLGSFTLMVFKWRSYLFEKEKHKLERIIADRTEELVMQKERAEQLVANILPKQTAEELKVDGRASRKKYKMATVLFSDIQGFTGISDDANPEIVLDELDRFFTHFDSVVERLNIEKIKTIGDTYMCAGGIPTKNRTNPIDVVMAAIEMRSHMSKLSENSDNNWSIRVGIHSGPVIAGIAGSKKISYDIWGDTVNIASRMEAAGKPGEICISEVTHELVSQYFECRLSKKIPVKFKGDIKMYFVKGLKPEFSDDKARVVPNQTFITKLQMIRFDDLEELVMTKLEKGLPKNLYYHNLKHTIDVITQTEVIGRKECVTDEEMILLKTAALFHDAGFLIGYDEHELLGIKLAGEILPDYYYSEEQIQIISELIYSTKMPPEPKNKLEEIMCDADLDYLGRTDFIPVSQNLFRELYEHGKIKTIEEWNKLQVNFISGHQYYTESACELRNVNKQKQLEKIRTMV